MKQKIYEPLTSANARDKDEAEKETVRPPVKASGMDSGGKDEKGDIFRNRIKIVGERRKRRWENLRSNSTLRAR